MQVKIEAYQVSESFNIKKLRSEFRAEAHIGNNSELFYVFNEINRYLYVFDYGVVVFANYDDITKSNFLRFIKTYSDNWLDNELTEAYRIEIDEKTTKSYVKNDYVKVTDITPSVMRIVMLNTGQSVALEYYEMLTDELLNSMKTYTQQLELKGKLSVSKTALLKYIGKVLNVKNSIVDNLYILDDPNMTWEDEDINRLNHSLKANFDTNARFKDLDYRLQIIENNLKIFTDLLNHRESQYLEWIIIILIFIEIVNALFFHK